ncbi:MAG: aryl-sulfate sulfotransferase [Oscillospiraceae bacterium]|nr:aryl-sulfate sulfotransferase [Oscillospiraceae bacterium]
MIKLEMNKKQEAILAAIIIVAAIVIFVSSIMSGSPESDAPEPPPAPEPIPPPAPLIDVIYGQMQRQEETDDWLLSKLDTDEHNLENPIVSLNPYDTSPLTALVLFDTKEPAQVSVKIISKTQEATIFHTFKGYNNRHILPVYGLYPGAKNIVEITAKERGGAETSALFLIETQPMPDDILNNLVPQSSEKDSGEPSGQSPETTKFYFTHVKKTAFDANGDYRWYYDDLSLNYPTKYLDNGNMFIVMGTSQANEVLALEVNMLGKIISAETISAAMKYGGLDEHQITQRPMYADD